MCRHLSLFVYRHTQTYTYTPLDISACMCLCVHTRITHNCTNIEKERIHLHTHARTRMSTYTRRMQTTETTLKKLTHIEGNGSTRSKRPLALETYCRRANNRICYQKYLGRNPDMLVNKNRVAGPPLGFKKPRKKFKIVTTH